MRYPIIVLFLFLFFYSSFQALFSQDTTFSKTPFYVEGFYNYGFVTPHHSYMAFFVNEHVKGLQLQIGIQTKGNKNWHKNFNYPKIGLGYHFSTLSNNEIFGNMSAIYAFVDRYYLNNSKRFNFGNRISFGMSYVNKKFELYSNPFDMAISSNINIYINYCIEADLRLSPYINLKTGIGVTHISNGNVKQPNKGLNFITSFVGLKYSPFKNTTFKPQLPGTIPDSSKHQFVITGSAGWKNPSRFNTGIHSVYSVSCEYSYKVSQTGWIGAALINYFDGSLKGELEYENPDYLFKRTDYLRTTFSISYEMKMGNFSFLCQPGIYIKNVYKHNGNISNRIGMRYYLLNGITANLFVKAHWLAIADVLEWGIGYKF